MRKVLHLGIVWAAISVAGCAGTALSTKQPPPPPPSSISVVVSPPSANIRAADSFPFAVAVSGTTNTAVTWYINTTPGGSGTLGTISTSGNYTAPVALPNPNTITVRATSAADASASGTSTVTLLNPTPVLTGVNPASVGTGNFSLTVTGSKFVSGAQVFFGTAPLQTTFVSTTQLAATGSASSAGTYPITVTNPSPGTSSSSSVNLQVTGSPQPSNCGSMSLGQGANLGGFVPFPADSLWNTDISSAPVDPNSTAVVNFIGSGVGIHADFGAGQYQGSTIGIPYLIIGAQQPPVTVNFTAYGSESDPGPCRFPSRRQSRATPILARATVTYWFSTIRLASSTNSTVLMSPEIPGTPARRQFGICFRTNSVLTHGPAPMPPDSRSSPDSRDTMKSPPERFPTPCVSRCNKAAPRSFLPLRTGLQIP